MSSEAQAGTFTALARETRHRTVMAWDTLGWLMVQPGSGWAINATTLPTAGMIIAWIVADLYPSPQAEHWFDFFVALFAAGAVCTALVFKYQLDRRHREEIREDIRALREELRRAREDHTAGMPMDVSMGIPELLDELRRR